MEIKRITGEKDLKDALYIRKIVFVEEQGVPVENEFDGYDAKADHILVYYNNQPVATGRLRVIDGVAKLERICVITSYRKHGYGKVIVQELEKIAIERGIIKAKLHGQTHAMCFYEKSGYTQNSEVFMEEGIPHISMIKNL